MHLKSILAAAVVASGLLLAGGAAAQPAGAPADQARAFLTDYFAAEQRPPRRAQRKFEEWMTSRFAALYRQAQARSRNAEEPFLQADPVLNAQDSDRPGDIRIETVGGPPDRPEVRVSFRVFAGDQARTTQILVFAEDRGEWRLFDIRTPQEGGGTSSFRQYTERYLGQGRPRR
ncbi:MAG: DUF3828 domain-containing protein [Phreatobacter sp.]|uniref:hypothetical protein n=1 Tax=Phreatobacter sp. TaxID=1966341 RepID=UPI001A63531C|nr:hypothetical protein [Phreatobacter sp.]MBL8567776.1 DUF3828 domain-containing protein [Phreatobacter sp.]